MADPIRLFILAGEPSGDRIGADLVRRLRIHRPVALTGVGGDQLAGEGLTSLFPMSDLSVMGIQDVLKRAPLLLWRIRQTVNAILATGPDVVVLIDSQVFCQTVARQLRKRDYKGQIILYVAPSVWAYKPERAPMLKPLYDEVLAVLPFEPAVMKRLEGPTTTYVGHPALEHTSLRATQPDRGPLLLLPGSRRGELKRHLPLMEEVTLAMKRHERVTDFVLPTPKHEEEFVLDAVRAWDIPVFVTSSSARKWQAFHEAVAAVAVTGTVTLGNAVALTPDFDPAIIAAPATPIVIIDNDGTVACLADLATDSAYHATVSNKWSIGIEMRQEPKNNGVYEATYQAAAVLVPALCRLFGIQFQMPKLMYTGHPFQRMLDGGPDMIGVFGHRNNTESRGRGDPGEEIFGRLQAIGCERFDFEGREDLDVWKQRQTDLNAAGANLVVDGQPGPKTIAALKAAGGATGIWALDH